MAKTKTTSKSKTANKSRVNKKVTKKPVSKLLIGGILVGIIAVVGIVVVYTSQAAQVKYTVDSKVYSVVDANCFRTAPSANEFNIYGVFNTYCRYGDYSNGTPRWRREKLNNAPGDYKCAIIFSEKTRKGWNPVYSTGSLTSGEPLRFGFTDTCN